MSANDDRVAERLKEVRDRCSPVVQFFYGALGPLIWMMMLGPAVWLCHTWWKTGDFAAGWAEVWRWGVFRDLWDMWWPFWLPVGIGTAFGCVGSYMVYYQRVLGRGSCFGAVGAIGIAALLAYFSGSIAGNVFEWQSLGTNWPPENLDGCRWWVREAVEKYGQLPDGMTLARFAAAERFGQVCGAIAIGMSLFGMKITNDDLDKVR